MEVSRLKIGRNQICNRLKCLNSKVDLADLNLSKIILNKNENYVSKVYLKYIDRVWLKPNNTE